VSVHERRFETEGGIDSFGAARAPDRTGGQLNAGVTVAW